MDEHLTKYGQNPPEKASETREESISRQFYEWERRGRGWQVYDFAVELEPPFRPFYFFEPVERPPVDDGRISTFFSRLVGDPSATGNSGNVLPSNALAQIYAETREYEAYIAEADEPDFCGYYTEDFREVRLVLPNDLKTAKPIAEQLLLSLAYASHPISFEVIGNAQKIVVQFAATERDVPQLRQQLKAHLPGCAFLENGEEDYLTVNWINSGSSMVIVDFGLSEEFMLPLDTIKGFDTDPLIAIIGAMSNLQEDEIGIFQILFQKARHDWPQEIINTLRLFEDTEFFSHIPDIYPQARQKVNSPLFSVIVRAAAKSSYEDSAWRIARNIGGGLVPLARPAGNELIPLSNDGYEFEYHEQALLDRQSFRCGMLLNTEELVSLVHPPSHAVRSEKLVRESDRTKAVPNSAMGHSLVLGENTHQDEVRRVTLSNDQRTRHVHVIGSSGSGKSTLLLKLIKQDMEQGQGLCVIDPHGDLIDDVIANVPDSRTNDIILFDPSDSEYPIGFNILQARTELEKTILSSDLVATFRRMSTSWGDVMDSVLANAILAIIESSRGGTLFDLKRFLIEKSFRDEFLKSVTDDSICYFWQHEFPLIANKPQASILIRLDTFLRQKLVRNIVCQKETKLNFREIMDSRKILLIKLSQGLIGEENAHLLGTLLVSKLYQTALSRQETQQRPCFWLYLDEFQHFVTPSMESILSGSRKYNLGLTLAHQEFRQLQSRSQDVASSVLSNCYTRVCFRLGDTDAEKFASGFSFFDAKALQNLGIGEAIGRIERSEHDFNLNVPPVPKVERQGAERRMSEIVNLTRNKYAKPKQEVEAELFKERKSEPVDAHQPTDPKAAHSVDRIAKTTIQKKAIVTDAAGQHRYLQSIIKRIGESNGFVATIEKEVFGGIGKVDVALESKEYRIACEIAVTNTVEYELQNIQKCVSSGFDKVVVISPDTKHLQSIRRKAKTILSSEQIPMVQFLEPENFHLFLEALANTDSDDVIQTRIKGYEVTTAFKQTSEQEARTRRHVITDILANVRKRKGTKDG